MTEDTIPYVVAPEPKVRQRFRPTTAEAESKLSALATKAEEFRRQRDAARLQGAWIALGSFGGGLLLGLAL